MAYNWNEILLYFCAYTVKCKCLKHHCVCLLLERVDRTKYLGIRFDYRLKFAEHIYFNIILLENYYIRFVCLNI